MSLLQTINRSVAVVPALLMLCLMVWSCAPSGDAAGGWSGGDAGDLDEAVRSYIAGDYEIAVEKLESLTGRARTEEQFQEVYLYLGRAYLARESYNSAIDSFLAGKAHGGGSVFDEYLQRLDAIVSGTQENVARTDHVTRAQLIVLIERMFYDDLADVPGTDGSRAGDRAIAQMDPVARGLVSVLPDGDLHADAPVTRAAFYVVVQRLIADRQIDTDTGLLFAGGFDWTFESDGNDTHHVTGKEVVTTLERVAAAKNAYGGQGP